MLNSGHQNKGATKREDCTDSNSRVTTESPSQEIGENYKGGPSSVEQASFRRRITGKGVKNSLSSKLNAWLSKGKTQMSIFSIMLG